MQTGIKRCGIVRHGKACGTVIPLSARACAECHASVVAELERMADEPAPPIVPRGTPRVESGTATCAIGSFVRGERR
jgi:hypothetical protein